MAAAADDGLEGVLAAIRHFPARMAEIESLARASERFREICGELADAEAALAAVDRLEEALRAERRLEWLGFVRSALKEIDGELRHARIVSIGRTGRSDG
ncbi:MAG: hypothetical protein ABS35_40885 [Kaistia sp. SCN 65-12]|nr:MAG: hypothetical protein ABS35_40885 [Kaistia sp. SCN 65-12]